MSTEKSAKQAVFNGKQIRKTLHEGEWWFSIIDVVEVLAGGDRPRKYWNDLKKKLLLEGYDQLSEKIGQLKIEAYDKIVLLKMAQRTEHRAFSVNTDQEA
jgi:hypothetical protein